jgi:hypothetical protein
MRQKMGILCSFSYLIVKLSGFETDGLQELVEGGDSASIEAIELGSAGVWQVSIGAEWT